MDTKKNPVGDDDEEGDIADDPLTRAIFLELKSVDKRNDRRLLIALAINCGLVWLVSQWKNRTVWIDVLGAGVLLVIVVGTIYWAIWQKQRIAIKHGLVCSNCGDRPWVQMIMSTATTKRCSKCRGRLNVT